MPYIGKEPEHGNYQRLDPLRDSNNDDFDKRYNELLKKVGEIKLISNKTNLISDECIWAYGFKDSKNGDKYKTLSRFISRINLLFSNSP